MHKNTPEIQSLRQDIEQYINRKICTPVDFDFLANAIWEQQHQYISATTLKRLWGYISGAETVRHTTLCILAQFIGYTHWEHYVQHLASQDEVESNAFIGKGVRTEQLSVGDLVEVSWQPNRHCLFRYLGKMQFVVAQSTNSKLHEGDTFTAACFLIGQPMYLDNLRCAGTNKTSYVAGMRHGITNASIHRENSVNTPTTRN